MPEGGRRRRPQLTQRFSCAVVGGGIAGMNAAAVLAERGAEVTLYERHGTLGGRLGGWPTTLADGRQVTMERGFHAFFRQYYNLRRMMRRIDPELQRLTPCHDYPLIGPDGASQSFADLPKQPPLNIAAVVANSPYIRLRDVLGVNVGAAIEMLAYDPATTYQRWDGHSAASYLERLRFPSMARRMLFDVFAHSFFNPEEEMSAGELLMMFHFYFTGNPEGLVFDVLDDTFLDAFIQPFTALLERLGVRVRAGHAVESVARRGDRFEVQSGGGRSSRHDACVLATDVPGLKALFEASPDLDDPVTRRAVASLDVTSPFAVLRLWLDRPTRPGRSPFVGTTGRGRLDNISLYHLIEAESARWAREAGGSVVELHAYGLTGAIDEALLRAEFIHQLHAIYPETASARIIDERFLLRRDCPAFKPGSAALRPGVVTGLEGLMLAGDFVKLPFPTALMERAAASGALAANALLGVHGVRGEPLFSVPRRGLLAGPWRLLRPLLPVVASP